MNDTLGPAVVYDLMVAHDSFQAGDLTAVIGDNAGYEAHREGYNGIHRLVHKAEPATLFVPSVAGLNLEHVFDGSQELAGGPEVFFEPRRSPMEFRRISDTEAELHQPPIPTFHLESWTRFTLVPPHSIDIAFRCVPHQHCFRHGYIGIFWASYINAPEDKSLYFRGGGRWLQHCTPKHDNQSTVLHKDDAFELKVDPGTRDTLYRNFSPLRFDEPLYYGLYRNMAFALMFDRTAGIRFAHSPSGGGDNREHETSNPAWDFQFIIPKYEVLAEYGFRARAVYRERCPRREILEEYRAWRKSLEAK
jgi:hypothetical protein